MKPELSYIRSEEEMVYRRRDVGKRSKPTIAEMRAKKPCFGRRFDPDTRECTEWCAYREDCEETFDDYVDHSPRTSIPRRVRQGPIRPPARRESPPPEPQDDYEMLDPEEGERLGAVYARNAALGAAEAATEELLNVFQEWPRKRYRFRGQR